ncbi:MAG: HD domain-containing protein [Magnetococcales bacterium]|nr:HD domain-containing protein [Magnetococcales bacterium]
MIDYLDSAFGDYGSKRLDLADSQLGILKLLMIPAVADGIDSPPTHLFLAEIVDDQVDGYIYSNDGQKINRLEPKIVIDRNRDLHAILDGVNRLTFANWEDDAESLDEFQNRFHPMVLKHVGVVERYTAYNSGRIAVIAFYKEQFLTDVHARLLKDLVVFASGLHRIAHEQLETEKAFIYNVESLARASEVNDEDTGDHILRINEYSKAIAEKMGLSDEFVRTIHYSAQMHDVGKIHVSANILKKPGRLTPEEVEQMKEHPLFGAKILGNSPRLVMASEIASAHHEKYNGKGYPLGLAGEAIPLSARIVAITDVYDALRQKRVYKPAFSHEKAMDIISQGDGRTSPDEFDPDVLAAFIAIQGEMAEIFANFKRS